MMQQKNQGVCLPLDIVAEIHSNEQLIGQERGFCRWSPNYQTHRYQERRKLLDEPREFDIHRKSILAGSVSPVWDVLEKQRNERAGCHEKHKVSHALQDIQLLVVRREKRREQGLHGGGRTAETQTINKQCTLKDICNHPRCAALTLQHHYVSGIGYRCIFIWLFRRGSHVGPITLLWLYGLGSIQPMKMHQRYQR